MDIYNKAAKEEIEELVNRKDHKCLSFIGDCSICIEFENEKVHVNNEGGVEVEEKDNNKHK